MNLIICIYDIITFSMYYFCCIVFIIITITIIKYYSYNTIYILFAVYAEYKDFFHNEGGCESIKSIINHYSGLLSTEAASQAYMTNKEHEQLVYLYAKIIALSYKFAYNTSKVEDTKGNFTILTAVVRYLL